MIPLLLITPIVCAALALAFRQPSTARVLTFLCALTQLGATLTLWLGNASRQWTDFFRVDKLNMLFMLILALVFVSVSIYNFAFARQQKDAAPLWRVLAYHIFLLLFVNAMNGVLLSTHLGMLWVFIEASTLTSAVLVYHYEGKSSLEATWKYIFICSIGISLAFIGIILLSLASVKVNSLLFDNLCQNSENISKFWLKMAFPFMLVGFGTKMGLAPGHNWLPDAHSEAPSPISAMLSATLLNAAFIGILRLDILMGAAGLAHYSKTLLITMGCASLFVSAVFIVRARNFKRMLAYSSIENMGLLALGAGIGGLGVFAAMLHMLGHSLSKAAFFLGSGNLYALCHSKDISAVRGLFRSAPLSAWLWTASALALCAFPPFATFLSKFLLLAALIKQGRYVLLGFTLVLLTVILYGLAYNVFKMVFGEPIGGAHDKTATPVDAAHGLGFASTAPQIILLGTAAFIGVYIPEPVLALLKGAASFLGVAQ